MDELGVEVDDLGVRGASVSPAPRRVHFDCNAEATSSDDDSDNTPCCSHGDDEEHQSATAPSSERSSGRRRQKRTDRLKKSSSMGYAEAKQLEKEEGKGRLKWMRPAAASALFRKVSASTSPSGTAISTPANSSSRNLWPLFGAEVPPTSGSGPLRLRTLPFTQSSSLITLEK